MPSQVNQNQFSVPSEKMVIPGNEIHKLGLDSVKSISNLGVMYQHANAAAKHQKNVSNDLKGLMPQYFQEYNQHNFMPGPQSGELMKPNQERNLKKSLLSF